VQRVWGAPGGAGGWRGGGGGGAATRMVAFGGGFGRRWRRMGERLIRVCVGWLPRSRRGPKGNTSSIIDVGGPTTQPHSHYSPCARESDPRRTIGRVISAQQCGGFPKKKNSGGGLILFLSFLLPFSLYNICSLFLRDPVPSNIERSNSFSKFLDFRRWLYCAGHKSFHSGSRILI
jgi:hypothetical protein